MEIRKSALLFLFLPLAAPLPAAGASGFRQLPAIILRVEGEGTAIVRKRSGVQEVAGAKGEVFPGDRVITDSRTVAHLLLADGTLLKLGYGSELRLEAVSHKQKILFWAFALAHGSAYAMVEKSADQKTVRLRLSTPAATVVSRGGSFLLTADATRGTELFMLAGQAGMGAPPCELANACLAVTSGQESRLAPGQKGPAPPLAFTAKGLLSPGSPADGVARLALLRGVQKQAPVDLQNAPEAELPKALQDSIEAMASAQDRAIGRTHAQRLAMQAAADDGAYANIMRAADAFNASRGLYDASARGGVEDLLGQVVAAKFRLGSAVVAADAAGLFSRDQGAAAPADSGGDPWAGRSLVLKKSQDYQGPGETKKAAAGLAAAQADFGSTLVFVGAVIDQMQLGKPEARKRGGRGGAASSAASAGAGYLAAAPANPATGGASRQCLTEDCQMGQLANELATEAEGVVDAYEGRTEARHSRKKSKTGPVMVETPFFNRDPEDDGRCYATQQSCVDRSCASFTDGRRCSKDERVRVCTMNKVSTPCK